MGFRLVCFIFEKSTCLIVQFPPGSYTDTENEICGQYGEMRIYDGGRSVFLYAPFSGGKPPENEILADGLRITGYRCVLRINVICAIASTLFKKSYALWGRPGFLPGSVGI